MSPVPETAFGLSIITILLEVLFLIVVIAALVWLFKSRNGSAVLPGVILILATGIGLLMVGRKAGLMINFGILGLLLVVALIACLVWLLRTRYGPAVVLGVILVTGIGLIFVTDRAIPAGPASGPSAELTAGPPVAGLLLLAGLVVVALIAGLVWLFRQRQAWATALGVVVAMVLMAVMALPVYLFLGVRSRVTMEAVVLQETRSGPDGGQVTRSVEYGRGGPSGQRAAVRPVEQGAWDDPGFEADLYPSRDTAARGLAERLAEELKELVPADVRPCRIRVEMQTPFDAVTRDQITAILQRRASVADVPVVYAGEDEDADATLRIAGTPKRTVAAETSPHDFVGQIGWIRGRLTCGGESHATQVDYVMKGWVEDLPAYIVARWPGVDPPSYYRVIRSDGLWGSQREALDHAQAAAEAWIEQRVRDRISSRPGAAPEDGRWRASVDDDWLRRRVTMALMSWSPLVEGPAIRGPHGTHMLVDRFVQRFDRPYGRVHRAAMLLYVPDVVVEQLAEEHARHQQARMTTRAQGGVLLLLLGLLVVVTYLLLNAATRGYYRPALIGGSLIVLAIGVGFVMLFVA